MALKKIVVEVSESRAAEFEAFLKGLPTPQSPVAGDRLFGLAIATDKQRKTNLARQKENREILRVAKERGITA